MLKIFIWLQLCYLKDVAEMFLPLQLIKKESKVQAVLSLSAIKTCINDPPLKPSNGNPDTTYKARY